MHRVEPNPVLPADLPLENKLPIHLQGLIATVSAVATAALGFQVAGIVGLGIGALAGLGIAFAVVQHLEICNSQPLTDIDQASVEELQGLIDFYQYLPFPEKPQFQGSTKDQAREIQTWMLQSKEVHNCKKLSIYEKGLKRIPKEIGLFHHLTKLSLSGNQLKTLPPEIGKLLALRALEISSNKLETIPPEIGKLLALKTFYLSENQLEVLPPEIGKLQALNSFFLWKNRLQVIPPEIANLVALEILDLSDNLIQALPPQIGALKKKGNGYYEILE